MQVSNALIIDDNPTDILIGKTMLEKEGYVVHTASDGFAAIEEIRKQPMDLLMVDLNMPLMSGLEFLKQIQPRITMKDAAVIVMSARNQPKDVNLAVKFGATDYLVKPVDLMVFQEKLAKLKSKQNAWFQYPLITPIEIITQATLLGSLVSLSEVGFEVLSKTALKAGDSLQFEMTTEALDIGEVYGRVLKVSTTPDHSYRVQLSFIGLSDADRKKIRIFCATLKSDTL